ncbi:hypothetical protein [Sphaerotilus sp. FB-3]|uniref:hypothetical protein n=1 Tax=Sphaerotilus sp. FB-3 TaxID=2913396 RepID=UPI0020423871|nr:hypothetical protein [Sphaerotilus sp. FB-3]GKQ58451.1 hypothetical protein QMTAC487_23110 [Sphaerotilus sp. FB-3]
MPEEHIIATASPVRHRLLDGLLAATLCVMAGTVTHQAIRIISADWSSSTARLDITRWASGVQTYEEADWQRAHGELTRALALTPADATLHDAMTQLYSLQGQALWTLGEAGSPEVEAYGIALKHQLESIKLRPTHAQAWANLSLLHYAVNDPADTLFAAWREAARLGPKEEDVENTLVRVAGDTWSIAPADVRAWVEERRPGFTKQMEPQPAN